MDKDKTMTKRKLSLIAKFLKKSKRYFAVALVSAAVMALADMLNPQIIRVALDNVIGGQEADGLVLVINLFEIVRDIKIIGNSAVGQKVHHVVYVCAA